MEIDWHFVARYVAVVVMLTASYIIGKMRGRDEGFMTAIIDIATKKIEIDSFEVNGINLGDTDKLEELLGIFEEEDE